MILLDTDVMVDILRGHEPAKVWLETVDEIGVAGLVAMELIQGCQNAREQRMLEKDLSDHLSDNIGLLDALIAETAIGLHAKLATFNVKHYHVIDGLQSLQPYTR